MPTLALDPAIDTTAPGLTRRRLWMAPNVRSHSLIALTLTKLSLAPPSMAVGPQVAQRIQNGADIEATLGEAVTTIELSAIRRVKFDLVANALTVDYDAAAGRRYRDDHTGTLGHNGRVVLAFADHDSADEVYTKIWRRLGERFELKSHRRDAWDVARFPVAVMAGILILTTVLGILGSAAADAERGSAFWKQFASYDWRVVCGFGGGSLAILQMWLYRRLTQPPKVLELGLKYAG